MLSLSILIIPSSVYINSPSSLCVMPIHIPNHSVSLLYSHCSSLTTLVEPCIAMNPDSIANLYRSLDPPSSSQSSRSGRYSPSIPIFGPQSLSLLHTILIDRSHFYFPHPNLSPFTILTISRLLPYPVLLSQSPSTENLNDVSLQPYGLSSPSS